MKSAVGRIHFSHSNGKCCARQKQYESLSVVLMLLMMLVVCGVTSAQASDEAAPSRMVPYELTRTHIRQIPLEPHSSVAVMGDQGPRAIPVRVDAFSYKAKLLKITPDRVIDRPDMNLYCYELRSEKASDNYEWSVWSWNWFGTLKLFSSVVGRNYLTWVEGGGLGLAEVTRPVDRSSQLLSFLSNHGRVRESIYIPVIELCGGEEFFGYDALNYPINVLSVGKSEDGQGWVVEVSGTKSDRVYRLVSDKSAKWGWRIDSGTGVRDSAGGSELRGVFEKRYRAWRDADAKWLRENSFLSYTPHLPEMENIVKMGPAVLPFLVERLEVGLLDPAWRGRTDALHIDLIHELTLKSFDKDEWPEGKYGDHYTKIGLYVKWWKEGPVPAKRRFGNLYFNWHALAGSGDTRNAEKIMGRIERMGVQVLPLVMEKIEAGDDLPLPYFNRIAGRKVLADNPTAEAAKEWWRLNESFWRFPEPGR